MQEMQDTEVQFLGQEDTLKEEMATHSSILSGTMDRGATVHRVAKSQA